MRYVLGESVVKYHHGVLAENYSRLVRARGMMGNSRCAVMAVGIRYVRVGFDCS